MQVWLLAEERHYCGGSQNLIVAWCLKARILIYAQLLGGAVAGLIVRFQTNLEYVTVVGIKNNVIELQVTNSAQRRRMIH